MDVHFSNNRTARHRLQFFRESAASAPGRPRLRSVFLLAAVAAFTSCGGGDAQDSVRPQQAHGVHATAQTTGKLVFAADLRTSLDGFTYRRPSSSTVLDYDGVNLPLAPDEPGFIDGRRVKNEFLNSELPARWLLSADGASSYDSSATAEFEGQNIGVLRVHHAEGQTGAPYIQQTFGAEPGSRPPALFASRFMLRQTVGALGLSWTHQGRTFGQYIGSESNSPRTSLSLTNGAWQTTSQTLVLYEQHPGWVVQAPKTVLGSVASFDIAHMQFEDVTGFKPGKEWSSEYVPSTSAPGIQWFETTKNTSRTCCSQYNPPYGTFNSSNQAVSAGGDLVDHIGSPIDVKGLMLEGDSRNLIPWSGLSQVGVAVLDGVSKNYAFVAPAAAGSREIYLDPRSGRFTWKAKDIVLDSGAGPDRLVSTTTDFIAQGWRAGMGAWLFLTESVAGAADGGVQGPFEVATVGRHELTFTSSGQLIAKAAGQSVNVARIPKPGDNILIVRNDGSHHRSTVAGITLPDIPQSTDPDGHQHLSVKVSLDTAMPDDGIHGGIAGTNNNLPVYYYSASDLPVTATPSNGGPLGTYTVDREWARVVNAGLGFQLNNGLVYELKGGASGNTLFDFAGVAGTPGRSTSASAFVRRVSGTGKPLLLLKSHPGGVPFTNAEFERVEWRGISVNSTGSLRLFVPANTTVQVALPQVEQAQAGREAHASSLIVTQDVPVVRAATTVSRPWTLPLRSARVAFEFTPTAITANRQTLWADYAGPDSYAEVAIVGSKVQFVLRTPAGVDSAEADVSPGTMLIEAKLSNGKIQLAVNGLDGPGKVTSSSLGAGTQYLGSLAGQNPAYGAIRNLRIYDTGGAGLF